jgi:sugar (pentulose or hexulose) kinase
MNKIPVILIYDVGKTNKKIFLFDEHYNIVYEESRQLPEIKDEDGFPCEDVKALTNWVKSSFNSLVKDVRFEIKAINISAYGASFVYLDKNGKVSLPLYNYLRSFPQDLQNKFNKEYGDKDLIAQQTASPVLGNLNSGMQLYYLKYEKPDAFVKIKYALHLPQYLCYILCDSLHADITSIGCHTNLWDFEKNNYHQWVRQEGIDMKFPPVKNSSTIAGHTENGIPMGAGLHDSSAALIPYLASYTEPFILISTGTWSISLNPFNHTPLTDDELRQDCLCYLSYEGKPVKASRLFAGNEHEQQVRRLAEYFNTNIDQFKNVKVDFEFLKKNRLIGAATSGVYQGAIVNQSEFAERDLATLNNYDRAYHQLIADIMDQQVRSTNLVLKGTSVKKIFVDGGFSNNPIYMQMLADAFPAIEVYAASVAQASALGAALVIHHSWNKQDLKPGIIKLKLHSSNLPPST